jgi:hypothetical protein
VQLQDNIPGKTNKITPEPAIAGFPQFFAITASSVFSQSRHERFDLHKSNSTASGWLIDVAATYALKGS